LILDYDGRPHTTAHRIRGSVFILYVPLVVPGPRLATEPAVRLIYDCPQGRILFSCRIFKVRLMLSDTSTNVRPEISPRKEMLRHVIRFIADARKRAKFGFHILRLPPGWGIPGESWKSFAALRSEFRAIPIPPRRGDFSRRVPGTFNRPHDPTLRASKALFVDTYWASS
jgi:hypothetical protein